MVGRRMDKLGPFALAGAQRSDLAVMQLDDRAADGQPKAEPAKDPGPGAFALFERIKNARPCFPG